MPLLLTAAQAAALLGRSVRTWRTWDAAGKIPQAIRVGRSAFWRPDELRAWVAAGCPDRATWKALQ
jgi:predicted DNA-binding transcriptional regulator AlpA